MMPLQFAQSLGVAMSERFGQFLRWIRDKILEKPIESIIAVSSTGLLAAVYVVWQDSIEPRINNTIIEIINDYHSGALRTSALKTNPFIANKATESLNELRHSLRNEIVQLKKDIEGSIDDLRSDIHSRWGELTDRLYGDVDAVYPINIKYTREILGQVNSPVVLPIHIYADPTRHKVVITLTRSGSPFDISLCINNEDRGCENIDPNMLNNYDLTERIIANKIQGTGQGRIEETIRPRINTQRIIIKPSTENLSFSDGFRTTLEGYIIVTRSREAQRSTSR